MTTKVPDVSIECLTIVNSSDINDIENLLKQDVYLHPVAVDSTNIFSQLNDLSPRYEYHTFLLDVDNKVLAIGNPVLNPKIKELYKQIILNGEEDFLTEFNEVYARSFGIARRNSTLTTNFSVPNKENDTLHIQALIPSCDCVKVTSNSDIMLPNTENVLSLILNTDSLVGDFFRYVDIFYKEKDSPDRLTVYGFIK